MKKFCGGWKIFPLALLLAAGCATGRTASHFSGNDLAGWRQPTGDWKVARSVSLDPGDATQFVVTPGAGIFVNGDQGKASHFVMETEFGDAEIHVEFSIPKNSNSGVYVMGRYEVQVYDSFGVEQDKYPGIECGGIYPRWINEKNVEGHSPRVNASKSPGEWQTFDITFRAPRFDASGKKIANAKFVKVVHNGKVIHANVEVTGPTRSSLFGNEKAAGPLMLQGDHGPVAYRNIRIKTATLD
ncbi:MAG: DUF1080 domain-containing protein [Pedosphaera sp.]|nr:DUF1080 domain-containing protein [Pedosphaera sp.]